MNPKGYLIDDTGNIINKEGKLVIPENLINEKGEIHKVFKSKLENRALLNELRESLMGEFSSPELPTPADRDGTILDINEDICSADGY